MKLAEIPRVAAGKVCSAPRGALDVLEQERHSLGMRAADLLGYRGLIANVTGESVLVKRGKLSEILNGLGIEVLDLDSVLTYQMQEIVRLTRAKIEENNLDDWAYGYFTPATWQKQGLSEYPHAIPEFAIDIALRIKDAVPTIGFSVQFLSEPKADPFLVAYVGKEIYYVAAWDEPGFEGRSK